MGNSGTRSPGAADASSRFHFAAIAAECVRDRRFWGCLRFGAKPASYTSTLQSDGALVSSLTVLTKGSSFVRISGTVPSGQLLAVARALQPQPPGTIQTVPDLTSDGA